LLDSACIWQQRSVYRMCAQVAPSGECRRGYKPGAVVSSRLAPRVAETLLLYLACVPIFVVLSCMAACMYVHVLSVCDCQAGLIKAIIIIIIIIIVE